MTFNNERTEREWIALTQAKHQLCEKALQAAMKAAWLDLPTNERVRYFEFAYRSVRDITQERTN